MYTLKRSADGQLHGPLNKKLYATFAGRKAAALWARAEATKRGFGPETTKRVQIIIDGAKSLKNTSRRYSPRPSSRWMSVTSWRGYGGWGVTITRKAPTP